MGKIQQNIAQCPTNNNDWSSQRKDRGGGVVQKFGSSKHYDWIKIDKSEPKKKCGQKSKKKKQTKLWFLVPEFCFRLSQFRKFENQFH